MSEIKTANVSRAWYHPFSMYTEFSKKLISPPTPDTHLYGFGCVLTEWAPYGIVRIPPMEDLFDSTIFGARKYTFDILGLYTGMLKTYVT